MTREQIIEGLIKAIHEANENKNLILARQLLRNLEYVMTRRDVEDERDY